MTPARPRWRYRHWYHFVGVATLVALVTIAFEVARVAGGPPGGDAAGVVRAVIGGVAPALYLALPIIAAVTVGLLRSGAEAAETALRVLAVTLVAMLLTDLVPGSFLGSMGAEVARTSTGELISRPRTPGFAETSVIRTVGAAITGGLDGVSETGTQFPPDHPRFVATSAILKGGLLLVTPIAMGLALGLSSWVAERVSFRWGSDERVARVAFAWAGALFIYWILFRLSGEARTRVLFGGDPLWSVLVPHLLASVVGWLGWRRAIHTRPPATGPARAVGAGSRGDS